MTRTARVAVEKAAYSYDKLYDYAIPQGMDARPGMRAVVSFGRGGDRMALIVEMGQTEDTAGLKPLKALSDQEPVLGEEQLGLLKWLREQTFCTWFDALRVLLPAGYGQKLQRGYLPVEPFPVEPEEEERQVLALFRGRRTPLTAEDLPPDQFPEGEKLLEEMTQRGLLAAEDLIRRRVQDQTLLMVRLLEGWEEKKLTPKQQNAAELLSQAGAASVREICYFAGVTKGVVDKLVSAGAAEYFQQETYRDPYRDADRKGDAPRPQLSAEQEQAVRVLSGEYRKGTGSTALLYGVTGSGKTQVFLRMTDQVVSEGRQAIVLVPEISLTPQTIETFHGYFGSRVAVLHSGLSLSERLDEWKRIRRGLVDVVVGTRSAVFAPLERLGLIVIDEEQEHTYKSESAPRFDAREAARARIQYHKGLLILASATPSVESFYRAQKGEYQLVRLSRRYGGARLPDVTILDLRGEEMAGECMSQTLCEEILQNLHRGEQTILLLNRRGYSAQVKCMSCHQPAECPNCSIPLKYHAANNRLMCHYCGYSAPAPKTCPHCGSEYIRYAGLGTQKVEEELKSRFPDARVLRMDLDTTMQKYSHQKYLTDFREGNYDIMIGTQMVAKGLDFPKVTLVGVLGVDQSLYGEDFRSYERTFALVTQVVGRSGRNTLPGRAIIQTYTPENPVLTTAAAQRYEDFYHEEIHSRKLHLYPPFCRLYCIGLWGLSQEQTGRWAKEVLGELTRLLREEYPDLPVRLLGLSEGTVFKVAGKYRYKILIKSRNSPRSRELFSRILAWAGKNAPKGASVFVDPSYDSSF